MPKRSALGVNVIDVRLKATDLPQANLEATFDRMKAEREREATDERARGNEAAQRVRAQADRTVVELVSDANREAEIIRGEADAERNAIFAEGFCARTPSSSSSTARSRPTSVPCKAATARLVLSPDSEFFNYLEVAHRADCASGSGI